MALNNVNLLAHAMFGIDCVSGGAKYKIILHLGDDLALAVRVPDPMPAQLYLIRIDKKPKEEQADENQTADRAPTETESQLPEKDQPKKPVDTIH